MIYSKNGKKYKVQSVAYGGAIVNVNGTSITDCDLMADMTDNPFHRPCGLFTVFVDGDEIIRKSFDEAYAFAMNEQKDTCRLER